MLQTNLMVFVFTGNSMPIQYWGGASDTTEVRINIWSKRMDIMGFVTTEDRGGDLPEAMLQTLTGMVDDFRREPKWEQPSNP